VSGKSGAAPRRVAVEGATWWPRTRVTPVFADLSLHVEPGQRVLLTGPNGCGKTVLLNAIQGAVPDPTAGEWLGTVTVADPTASDVTASDLTASDPTASDPTASVPDATPALGGAEPVKVTKKALKAAFAAVGLRGLDPTVVDDRVSGGQGQLVRIARQLAASPPLLVFDEPVSMLDPGAVATATSAIGAATARSGATLVVAAHRLTPWLSHVDRVVVMDGTGRIIADGPTAQVLERHTQALLAAGIWVPGRADPTPDAIGIAWDAPAVQRRAVIARAESVTVRHNDADLVAEGLPGLRREVTAIRDGDLDLLSGQCVALVGPTGAGGSSWLSALAGVVAAEDGTISWSGAAMHVDNAERGGRLPETSAVGATLTDPDDDAAAGMPSVQPVAPHQLTSRDIVRALGWMPQDPSSTVLGATVRDDLLTTALAAGLAPDLASRRADVLLDALGLTRLAVADPRTLSSGESRRLSLAGAVIHQPALLLADQPTVEQDRHGWAAVTGILESLRAAGSAVLVTTHDGGLTPYADRIVGVRPPRVSAGKSTHARTDAEAAADADLVVVTPVSEAPEEAPGLAQLGVPEAPSASPSALSTSASSSASSSASTAPAAASSTAGSAPSDAARTPAGRAADGEGEGPGGSVAGQSETSVAGVPASSRAPSLPGTRDRRSGTAGEGMGLWWVAFILVCGVFGFAGFVHFFGGAGLQDTAATALWWAGLAMAALLGGRAFRSWRAARTRSSAAQDAAGSSGVATSMGGAGSTSAGGSMGGAGSTSTAGSMGGAGSTGAAGPGDPAGQTDQCAGQADSFGAVEGVGARGDGEPDGIPTEALREDSSGGRPLGTPPDERARRLRGVGDGPPSLES
jgi:energy-coupling factor transporter ATP-binding protein EcfA2